MVNLREIRNTHKKRDKAFYEVLYLFFMSEECIWGYFRYVFTQFPYRINFILICAITYYFIIPPTEESHFKECKRCSLMSRWEMNVG
ncbi:hypothetical protein BG07_4447 [Bacillus pseudomycoides]|nr:hypothetical protein DJ92_487 [Bacillus pseudomycoides]AJI15556.1 hypothetical protein BG07_4447 [Bacillus pseudomycoides]